MSPIKVGIVEDDMIIAMSIVNNLKLSGYQTTSIAHNFDLAIEMIATEKPDIVLLDIMLGSDKDGVDLGLIIRQQSNIPVIFVTANHDRATITRAKQVSPAAYLVKPFDEADLYAAIEVAMHNYYSVPASPKQDTCDHTDADTDDNTTYRLNNAVFIKQGQLMYKVKYDDIMFLESNNTHLLLHTADRKLAIRSSLTAYLEYLDSELFIQVHRSYAVNIHMIDAIHTEYLLVGNHTIPVGRLFRTALMKSLRMS